MAGALDLAMKAFKGYGAAVKAAPVTTLGSTVLLGEMAAPTIKNLGRDEIGREMRLINEQRNLDMLRALKRRNTERLMAENTARLARADPHTYNEVLAGRRLPKGAVVFGGQPRVDLLEEMAYGMSSGRFPAPEQDGMAGLV